MFFVMGENENTIGMLGGIISFIQITFLTTPIFFTEKALKIPSINKVTKETSPKKTSQICLF